MYYDDPVLYRCWSCVTLLGLREMVDCFWCQRHIKNDTTVMIVEDNGVKYHFHKKCYDKTRNAKEVKGSNQDAYALYWCYMSLYSEECDTVEEAMEYLQEGEGAGSHSSVGVVDMTNEVAYVPIIREKDFEDNKNQLINDAFTEGMNIRDFRFVQYDTFGE